MLEALLRRFRTVESILQARGDEIMEIEGMTREVSRNVARAPERLEEAGRYVESLDQREISLVTRLDQNFPKLLRELNDPPSILYFRGCLPDPDKKTVTLSGALKASNRGIEMTSRLAREFAEAGVQVVSSLEGGIDAAAHLACAAAGGISFAIIDSGFDHLPQKEGVPVAIDVIESGGVISEYAPDTEADTTTMPQSNRLLAALTQAVVVTEVYEDSTRTLDLLKSCNEIGKLVFVMVDPQHGAFSDESALATAMNYGAIPIEGYDRVGDIVKSLV
jgi:DNA processing protein